MHLLCTSISEEGWDGEGADSKALSLMSYTLSFVSLSDLDYEVWVVITDAPVYMCERGEARQGESGSEAISLMSYILRYFSLVDIVRHGESTKKCYL